jgi:hypothetical protein
MSFQAILDKALDEYREQIGVELDKHPFSTDRGSPDDILKLLEDKANAFKAYRDGNRKLINWLGPVVRVVHTLSGVLGQAVSGFDDLMCYPGLTFSSYKVLFPPAQAIFAGVDVLITVRVP